MKKLAFLLLVLLVSCTYGVKENSLEKVGTLPPELRNMKVYTVRHGMGYVKIAVLDNQVNSTTYPVGKYTETTVIINGKKEPLVIQGKSVLFENEEIIVISKK